MSHLEEGDRDPCTPAHNRCVVIGNNFPPFLGWKTLILGPRIVQTPHTCRRPQSSEFHLLEIKPCFPSGRGSTKEFRITPHPQEPSGHPGRAPAPGPLLSSYPQVPALPGWLPLFPHCPKCHRSSAHSAPCLKYNLPSLKAFLHGQAHSPSPSLMPTRGRTTELKAWLLSSQPCLPHRAFKSAKSEVSWSSLFRNSGPRVTPGLPVQPQFRVPCGQRSPTLRGYSLFWRAAERGMGHMVFCGPGLLPLPQGRRAPILCPFTLSLGLRQPQAWPVRTSTPLAPGLNPGGGCPHGQPKSSKPGTLVRLLLQSPPLSMGKEQVWLIRLDQPATAQGP